MNVYVIQFNSAARQQSVSTWRFSHDAYARFYSFVKVRSFMMFGDYILMYGNYFSEFYIF